jgi:hypothetical protein
MLSLHDNTLASPSRLSWVLRLFDLRDHELEGLNYVLVMPRGGLGPGAVPLSCQGLSFLGSHLALDVQVTLVSNDDDGDPVRTLGEVSRCSMSGWELAESLPLLAIDYPAGAGHRDKL